MKNGVHGKQDTRNGVALCVQCNDTTGILGKAHQIQNPLKPPTTSKQQGPNTKHAEDLLYLKQPKNQTTLEAMWPCTTPWMDCEWVK